MATITKLFSNGLLQSAVELDEITYNSVKISTAGIYSAGFDETTLTGATERRTSDGKYLVSGSFDEVSIAPGPPPTLQGSLSFNGIGQYLSLSPGLVLSSGAFTIEGWLYNSSDWTSRGWMGTTAEYGMHLFSTDDYNIMLDLSGGHGTITYTWTPGTLQTNKWHYFILNRNASGLETMYVGTQTSPGAPVTCYRANFAAGNFDPNDYAAGTCIDPNDWYGSSEYIGRYYGGYFPGYITNFRATIGEARYDTNNNIVTAPSIELTSDAYTQYLMLGNSVTEDSSSTQTITNNGGVSQNSSKPF
jgi:Concanavalin A-like lectin/glucanases superfamily